MKLLLFFLTFCLVLRAFGQTLIDPDEIKVGKYYALLIAVKDYQDPSITDLDYPIIDAENLKATLQNYQFDEVKPLLNPTRQQIMKALTELKNKVKPTDNVLIFYSGHGYWDTSAENGYWLPVDAEKDNPSNWISNSDIKDRIKVINSQHTLLISDACFSGGIFKTREAFEGSSKAIKEDYSQKSRKAMTSGALTTVPDRSKFLFYLVEYLTTNTERYLSTAKLFNQFRDVVINNSTTKPEFGTIQDADDRDRKSVV